MSTQNSLDFDKRIRRPRARTSDPETSHEAAASISREALTDGQDFILRLLREHGPMTDEMIWGFVADRIDINTSIHGRSSVPVKTPSGARSRRKEITVNEDDPSTKHRPIRDSGLRRKTCSGRWAIVWEAV